MTVEEIVAAVLPGTGPVTNETGRETDHRWTSRAHMQIVGRVSGEFGVSFTHDEMAMCAMTCVADIKRALVMKGVRV